MQFVPMLWSTTQGHDGNQFLSQARGAKVVLGFNEPERVDQANMSPADAARAWKQYIEPLRAQGARLGSPAIASTDQGLNWLRSFVTELNKVGGRIDFIALHWYGRGVDNFIGWITNVRQQLGNKYPVERYAWFGAQRQLDAALGSANCLVAPNGQLSDLGKKYVHG
jgi:hypothetical protein